MRELLNSIQTPSQAAVVCCAILVLIPVALYLGRTAIETVKSFGIRTRLDELADSLKVIEEAIDNNTEAASLKKHIDSSALATSHLFAADLESLKKDIAGKMDTILNTHTRNVSVLLSETLKPVQLAQSIADLQSKIASLERSGQTIVNSINGIKTEGANRLQGIANKVETIVRHGEAIRSGFRAELSKLHDILNARPQFSTPSEPLAATSASEGPFLALDDEAFEELSDLPWNTQEQLPTIAPVEGQYGIQRDGTILDEPFEVSGNKSYPFTELSTGANYTAEGWWSCPGNPSCNDIVAMNTESGVAALRSRIVELTSKGLPTP